MLPNLRQWQKRSPDGSNHAKPGLPKSNHVEPTCQRLKRNPRQPRAKRAARLPRQPALELPKIPPTTIETYPPPTGYDLDRLHYHVDLKEFGENLQIAANAVFSCDRRSRYTQVSALLISWEDEDPKLPVSLEISELKDVFVNLYGFEVEEWSIPSVNSHMELNIRVLQFLKDSSSKHLKIVYYAGHGKVSLHGQAVWTSHRNSNRDRHPTVKWSGIQNALEESQSDVLILLDCCASGLSNTDEGNGATELLAACDFNNIANGVGPFSFTHALISQLRKLAHKPSFTVGYLYNLLFTDIQGLLVKEAKYRKPPVHLVLSQDHRLQRGIALSAQRPQISHPYPSPTHVSSPNINSHPDPSGEVSRFSRELFSSNDSDSPEASSPFGNDTSSSTTSVVPLPEYPRLLFSIRINENIKPHELSPELFADWLAMLPMETKYVRVEAGFASDSTLLIISMPIGFVGYLPKNPAVALLGVTRSMNILQPPRGHPKRQVCSHCAAICQACDATSKQSCFRCIGHTLDCRFTHQSAGAMDSQVNRSNVETRTLRGPARVSSTQEMYDSNNILRSSEVGQVTGEPIFLPPAHDLGNVYGSELQTASRVSMPSATILHGLKNKLISAKSTSKSSLNKDDARKPKGASNSKHIKTRF